MAATTPNEMPFLDHLEELRWRIIWSLLALIICVGVAFALLMKINILVVLQRPILPYLGGSKLVITNPTDAFSIVMSASMALGIMLALPVLIYQLWAFVAPALYRHEKRIILPVFFGATLLFIAGACLAYFVALPLTLRWLMTFQADAFLPMITAAEYFSFAINMALAFGACFELPVVILALAAFGIVTPDMLNKGRRFALVGCLILGAFLSPGDTLTTMFALALPMYLLYELSVVLSYTVHRRRMRKAAEEELAAAQQYGASA